MTLKRKHILPRGILLLIALLVSCSALTPPDRVGQMQSPPPQPSAVTSTQSPGGANSVETTPSVQTSSTPEDSLTISATNTVFLPIVTKAPTLPPIGGGRAFYIAPDGSCSNDGSIQRPFALGCAIEDMAKDGFFQAGDILWVRGGTYGQGGLTYFNSHLQGTKDRPIAVRAYPGEKAIINGVIKIYKPNVVFWGLEVMNTDPKRTSSEAGSFPKDIYREDAFNIYAANVTLINNIMHDTAEGVYADDKAVDAVIYGNLIYNNGWKGPDRGHGYGIYAQNSQGSKWIEENIIFNNFGNYSVHVYRESPPSLLNFNFTGNVTFNGEFLVGGIQPVENVIFTDHFTFNEAIRLSYESQANRNIRLQNTHLFNLAGNALEVRWWQGMAVDHNVIGNQGGTLIDYANSSNVSWDNNRYYAPSSTPFRINGQSRTWSQWRSQTGFDANSTLSTSLPTSTEVFLRPNRYEAKRGHIIVYNWANQSQIAVDLSKLGFVNGDRYEIHNAQNYDEVISGTYQGGSVSLPMSGWTVAVPIGWGEPLHPSTFPMFGVFIVLAR